MNLCNFCWPASWPPLALFGAITLGAAAVIYLSPKSFDTKADIPIFLAVGAGLLLASASVDRCAT